MEPAATIIARLGGDTAVARHLGLHRTRVAGWKRPRTGGGTDGRIPQWHVPALLELATTTGVALSPQEFLWPPQPPSVADIPAAATSPAPAGVASAAPGGGFSPLLHQAGFAREVS